MKITSLFLSLLSFLFWSGISNAQQRQGNWCASHDMFEEAMRNDKTFAKNQRDLEEFTAEYARQVDSEKASSAEKTSSVVRIIPVVVHVIHANGPENISKAQILSEIAVLNRDFRRLNADTTDTPGPFKGIAADSEIEFRMAQLDTLGNCTDGINRIYSPLTVYARNDVKSLIYWPRNKYLNIWIVKSIRRADGSLPPAGTIIAGFAQFPGGAAATDGVVVAAANFGTIGSAQGNQGRTTVHEVGHWLNLRHIWGDDNGACSGSDNVNDTPNQAAENFSTCPNFPALDACTSSGNGVMFSNYMDYTDEVCQDMYSVGQSTRMNAALSSLTSGRNNLWTTANLAATGVSTPTLLCAADFSTNGFGNIICEDGVITFTDASYNGYATTRAWTFLGGTLVAPSTLSDSIVTVKYLTAGNFDVSLTVTNATGSASITKPSLVRVLPIIAAYNNSSYTESFETLPLPNADWEIANLDGGVPLWQQNTGVGFSGTSSAFLENFNADSADVDELISPTFNGQAIQNISLTFQVAYARKNTADNDALKIWTSVDCGRTWSLRTTISAATLDGSNPLQTSYFTPTTAAQWHKETVNVANLVNKTNARIKFQFISGNGNNIYLDDINILTPLGVKENNSLHFDVSLYPNPAKQNTVLFLNLPVSGETEVKVVSVLGQVIETVFSGELKTGVHQFEIGKANQLQPGVYFVKTTLDNYTLTKKLIIE